MPQASESGERVSSCRSTSEIGHGSVWSSAAGRHENKRTVKVWQLRGGVHASISRKGAKRAHSNPKKFRVQGLALPCYSHV